MKVTKIAISNVYGIRHLELDGRPVELRGKKGTGKTSVIDAIRLALTNQGGRRYVIREGAGEGEVLIETDGGISVARKKRAGQGDYNRVSLNGAAVPGPQSFINKIFAPLQLNPAEFASWDEKRQNREILGLISFEWDMGWIERQFGEIPPGVDYSRHILQVLDDIQAKDGHYWKMREEANRKELYKRQAAAEIAEKLPAGYDAGEWEGYPLSEKIAQLQRIQKANGETARAKAFMENHADRVRAARAETEIKISAEERAANAEREGLKTTIERLRGELLAAEVAMKALGDRLESKIALHEAEYAAKAAKLEAEAGLASEYAARAPQPEEGLREEIGHAEKMIKHVSEYRLYERMMAECAELKETSRRYDEKIALARGLPGKVLESAELPIEGLTVEGGAPLINGLPISNLSTGEKIDLCVSVATARLDGLRILLLDGAEALDDESRAALYKKCREKGLQIIAARTTNDDEFTVFDLTGGEGDAA